MKSDKLEESRRERLERREVLLARRNEIKEAITQKAFQTFNETVDTISCKVKDGLADPRVQNVISATEKTAKKAGEISVNGLKVISGVKAVQDRRESISTREEADDLKMKIEETNDAIRKDLNETLEDFGKYRLLALKNTVGIFLDYLSRINQKSKLKEYEFLPEIDVQIEEINELQALDMNASQALKALAVGGGFAAVGLAGTPAAITSVITATCAASTGTAISSLSGAAATNAVLAWLGGGTVAAGGGGVAAGTVILGALTATATIGLAVMAVGTLAAGFYSKKKTEAIKYLADMKEWAAKVENSWVALDGVKARILELQDITQKLEAATVEKLKELNEFVDSFDATDKHHVEVFQRCAILVKSMSELAQTSVLDEAGNLSEQSGIVAGKTMKILNNEL